MIWWGLVGTSGTCTQRSGLKQQHRYTTAAAQIDQIIWIKETHVHTKSLAYHVPGSGESLDRCLLGSAPIAVLAAGWVDPDDAPPRFNAHSRPAHDIGPSSRQPHGRGSGCQASGGSADQQDCEGCKPHVKWRWRRWRRRRRLHLDAGVSGPPCASAAVRCTPGGFCCTPKRTGGRGMAERLCGLSRMLPASCWSSGKRDMLD